MSYTLPDFLSLTTDRLVELLEIHKLDCPATSSKPVLQAALMPHVLLDESKSVLPVHTDPSLPSLQSTHAEMVPPSMDNSHTNAAGSISDSHLQESHSCPYLSHDVKSSLLEAQKFSHLLPKFLPDSIVEFFSHFEKVANVMQWPVAIWNLLIQSQFTGLARETFNNLPSKYCLDYSYLKSRILVAYGKNPEAVRQQFRDIKKSSSLSWSQFSRLKQTQFEHWLTATQTDSFEDLKSLILSENLKNALPPQLRLHVDKNFPSCSNLDELSFHCDNFELSTSLHDKDAQSASSSKPFSSSKGFHKYHSRTPHFYHKKSPSHNQTSLKQSDHSKAFNTKQKSSHLESRPEKSGKSQSG